MLNPLNNGSRLSHLSPLRRGDARISSPESFSTGTGHEAGIYSPLLAAEQPGAPVKTPVWRRTALAASLAIAGGTGVLAMVPTAAVAQVQVAPKKQVKDPVLRQLLASSLVTGKVPTGTVEQRVSQLKPAVREELSTLPPQAQAAYVQLDPPARKWLAGQISGSSDTLFGKVQHRKAFIKGHVAIFNIFDLIKSKISDQVKSGAVPRQAQPRIDAYLDSLKQLQPGQREVLADALATEWSTRPA